MLKSYLVCTERVFSLKPKKHSVNISGGLCLESFLNSTTIEGLNFAT